MSSETITHHCIGKKYGRLTIIGIVGKDNNYRLTVKCLCECGNTKDIRYDSLISGKTRSCYCLQKETVKKRVFKHGYNVDYKIKSEYTAWIAAKKRCHNENDPRYKGYGARGIEMCSEWRHREDGFVNFIAGMGEKPEPKNLYSLDRINNDGNYEPGNCRWATATQQAYNKRPPLKNVEKKCEICGSQYFCTSYHANRSKFCGANCNAKSVNNRKKNASPNLLVLRVS